MPTPEPLLEDRIAAWRDSPWTDTGHDDALDLLREAEAELRALRAERDALKFLLTPETGDEPTITWITDPNDAYRQVALNIVQSRDRLKHGLRKANEQLAAVRALEQEMRAASVSWEPEAHAWADKLAAILAPSQEPT